MKYVKTEEEKKKKKHKKTKKAPLTNVLLMPDEDTAEEVDLDHEDEEGAYILTGKAMTGCILRAW